MNNTIKQLLHSDNTDDIQLGLRIAKIYEEEWTFDKEMQSSPNLWNEWYMYRNKFETPFSTTTISIYPMYNIGIYKGISVFFMQILNMDDFIKHWENNNVIIKKIWEEQNIS